MTAREFRFKKGTRVPAGATPEGVIAERDLIRERRGVSTIEASAAEVTEHPEDYPNLAAFGPHSQEEAMMIAVKDAIRKAYKSVVWVEVQTRQGRPVTEVRWFHAPRNEDGVRDYKTILEIRNNEKDLKRLVADLRGEADSYAQKLRTVLAEIEQAI